jgi:transposase
VQTEDETDELPAQTAELCSGRLHSHVRYKRLERGRFLWPSMADGVVTISAAQLSYLLSGIDWRMPQKTWRPEAAG